MKQIILFGVLLAAISSCTVYKQYPIDIYKPGEIALPPKAQNVALIYRNFKYDKDTLQHCYKDNYRLRKAKNDPSNLDSILVALSINELASNFKAKNTFNKIHIFPHVFKTHSGLKMPPLDPELISTLAKSAQADLLISLETFSYFFSSYSVANNMPSKSNEVITAAVWAAYNPHTRKLVERKTMIDTISWNRYNEDSDYQSRGKLPKRITALKIASQMAGENYSKRFWASWQTVNRTYSVPPLPDFSAAEEYLQKGEIDNAIMLWKRYARANNGRMAINARYNLAFAYELKDELDTATKWINAALQIASDYNSREDLRMIKNYKKILSKRKQEIERLKQM